MTLVGSWSAALTALCILMIIDYLSGVILAGAFHKSKKSNTGGLKSSVGLKGLCRKLMMLLFVLVAVQVDILLDTQFVRDATIIGFCANEVISIIENAGLMGLPIPGPIKKAVDVLNQKSESIGNA